MNNIVASLTPLIKPGHIVMIGEWHGTNEFPLLIQAVVEAAVQRAMPVIVGLEIPCSEQATLDNLTDPDPAGVDGSWWRRSPEFHDGRSSAAIATLVAGLAQMDSVTTVAMDGPWVAPGSAIPMELLHLVERPRDETMARHLLSAIDAGTSTSSGTATRTQRPFTVVLAGSEHTTIGVDANGQPRLGRYITQWHPRTVALLGRAAGGEAWSLRTTTDNNAPTESGPFPVPDDAELSPGAQWADQTGPDGHHGYVHVGPVTPSPPHLQGETP